MRQKSAGLLAFVVAATFSCTLFASQIQAFKNSPARPATAAHEMAKEQAENHTPETPEGRTEKALNDAHFNRGALYALLREMPKGADLHNHITGAVYAESLLGFAADSGLCLDRQTLVLSQPAAGAGCKDGQAEARTALSDGELYRDAINAWSMRGMRPGMDGHDHFFDSFAKFSAATEAHLGEILAEVKARAADGNVQYLELMLSPDHGRAAALGEKVGYDPDLAAMRKKMLGAEFEAAVAEARKNLDEMEHAAIARQHCESTPEAHTGPCSVHVRYIYSVSRGNRPERVYAQLLLGFELATRDPRVVGVNLVQPEDSYLAMRDFRLHMHMVGFLKGIYPTAHVSLHAGELRPGLVPPDGLRFHIRESVEVGKAERIGHGVDVMYEENPHELLNEMARRNVLVEICLTSNDGILGVRGRQHPLAAYLKAGVPVALATDDEGVSRSEMTAEYERAVLEQNLDYITLKKMARTSLEHSFLTGASLWNDPHKFTMVHECAGEKPLSLPSSPCSKFLSSSEKAREQWRLEHRFTEFESKF
jgi:hypothetical protein